MKYRAILLAFMMLSCMCVQAEDDQQIALEDLKTTIDGVKYEAYKNTNGEIKVKVAGLDDNPPANVSIRETVTFKVSQKDAEGNEKTKEFGPYEVDFLGCSFSSNTKIESVSLPNSIKELPASFFSGCSNLNKANNPDGVSIIQAYTFANTAITTITIPNSVTEINTEAFVNCVELKKVTIGSGVKTIYDAFKGCTKLEELNLGKVEEIGKDAFCGCSSLEKVTVPHSIREILDNAFMACTNLKKITIGSGIELIGTGAFKDCPNISIMEIHAKQPPRSGEIIDKKDNKPTLKVYGVELYTAWYWQDYFNIVPLVKDDKDDNNLYDLNKENKTASLVGRLPNNTSQSAPGKMRKAAENDESITIPQTITVEGDEYTVIAIESYALCNDSQTTSFSIPATITSIDEAAFQYCENMKSFYCLASQVPQTDATAFHGTDISNATLYVPKAAVENYLNGSPWNGFGTIEGIDATGIRDVALDTVKIETWYDLKGQVLTKKPHQKGVYIYKGKKIAIQ